jgi:formylglycine-generating enzyme required for sulfatase activity
MGSSPNDPDHRGNEDRQDVLLTEGFWLGKQEVTQAAWKKVMGSTPWPGRNEIREGDDYPASFVCWEDATAFCGKFTEQEHQAGRLPRDWVYTLPTEAQWEYACRAGSSTKYFFGDDNSRLGEFAWFWSNSADSQPEHAESVGKKAPNPWGLQDVHGNLSEWCQDWYQEKLPGGIDPVVSEPGTFRVFRGGAFGDNHRHARSATRSGSLPGHRSALVGFRVALVLADESSMTRVE